MSEHLHEDHRLRSVRNLYEQLVPHGELLSDRELARSPTYTALLRLGREIRSCCDRSTFLGLLSEMFPGDAGRSKVAEEHFRHLWAGLEEDGDWARFAVGHPNLVLRQNSH